MSDNITAKLLAHERQLRAEMITRGFVTGLSGNSVFVKRIDSDIADGTAWPRCEASFWPLVVGDEVLLLRLGSGWIVADRVIR